jgi:hypothetical protein
MDSTTGRCASCTTLHDLDRQLLQFFQEGDTCQRPGPLLLDDPIQALAERTDVFVFVQPDPDFGVESSSRCRDGHRTGVCRAVVDPPFLADDAQRDAVRHPPRGTWNEELDFCFKALFGAPDPIALATGDVMVDASAHRSLGASARARPRLRRLEDRRQVSANALGELLGEENDQPQSAADVSPRPIVRYAILHELAHTREMNHGARYWAVVNGIAPDYEVLDEQLRRSWRLVPEWIRPTAARPARTLDH